jgi:hypothetical protein
MEDNLQKATYKKQHTKGSLWKVVYGGQSLGSVSYKRV